MGGSINVTSKKGEGTQFRVELSFECEPQECISDASSFSSLNVLLIDTDDQSRPQVSSALHSLNVQTKEARSFKQANALLYGAGKRAFALITVFSYAKPSIMRFWILRRA